MENNKVQVSFVALGPYMTSNIPIYKEIESADKWVKLGDTDDYPVYQYSLYSDCPILHTIVDGTADFVSGNDVICNVPGFEKSVNRMGETAREVIAKCAVDYMIFGAFYLQVIRDGFGKVSEVYWLDYRYVRSSKYNEAFWYSEEFGKKYGRTSKALVYPRFIPGGDVDSSVIMVKSKTSRGTYGTAPWNAALKDINTMIEISKFHLNEVSNNFTASAVINFNAGTPTDEQRKEIEKDIIEKFTGSENAGRFVLSFNNTKDNATTIERLDEDNFDERYQALSKHTQQQIFAALGANPNLFGIPTENNGFSNEEYEESFRLYNRTRVRPIQQLITDVFDKIFGVANSLEIVPFSLDENKTTDTVVD